MNIKFIFNFSKMKKFMPKIIYTLDFIFDSLGYGYEIIEDYNKISKNDIIFFYSSSLPDLETIKRELNFNCMFFVPFDNKLFQHTDIYFEEIEKRIKAADKYKCPIIKLKTDQENDVKVTIFKGDKKRYAGSYHYDIIGNIFFYISGLVEWFLKSNVNAADSKGKKMIKQSACMPTVNMLLHYFEAFLTDGVLTADMFLIKKCMWPENQDKALFYSFEIDSLQKWKPGRLILSFFKDIFTIYRLKSSIIGIFKKIKFILTNEEPYWNFKEIVDKIDEHKLKTAFYFAAPADIDRKKARTDYNIDSADIQKVIHYLLENKQEISLLASCLTDDEIKFKKEFERILKVTETKPGIKLREREFSFKYHSKVFDKNIPKYSFNHRLKRHNGFKNGIALPYKPYDFEKDQALSYWEIPQIFASVNYDRNLSDKSIYENMGNEIKLFSNHLDKKYGIMNYNMKISDFEDLTFASKLYDYIIGLEKQKYNFQETPERIIDWWNKRKRVEFEVDFKSKYNTALLFNDNFENFAVKIIGNRQFNPFIPDSDCEYIKKNRIIYFKNIKKDIKIGIREIKEQNN